MSRAEGQPPYDIGIAPEAGLDPEKDVSYVLLGRFSVT